MSLFSMKVQVLITTLPVSQQKVVQQYQSVHQSINQSIMNQSQQRYDSIKSICQQIGNLFSCEAVASAVDSFLYSFCDWKNLSILSSMEHHRTDLISMLTCIQYIHVPNSTNQNCVSCTSKSASSYVSDSTNVVLQSDLM